MLRVKLRDGHDGGFKGNQLFLGNVQQRSVAAHPGGSGGGVNGKDALSGVEEVCRISCQLEGVEGPLSHLLRNDMKQGAGGVVEQLHLSPGVGIPGIQLVEHLNHHVVRGLVDEGNQHLLPVEQVIPLAVLGHGGFTHLPDKVPGQGFRQGKAQGFHVGLIDITSLGGTHVGNGVVVTVEPALLKKLGDNLLLGGTVEENLAASQTVLGVGKQIIQGHHRVRTGKVGGDVVGVGNAHVGGGIGGDVGDDIVVDLAVVGIQPQIHGDVGVERLEIRNGLLVDVHLGHVGIVFGPEGDLIVPGGVELLRDHKGGFLLGAVAAAESQ